MLLFIDGPKFIGFHFIFLAPQELDASRDVKLPDRWQVLGSHPIHWGLDRCFNHNWDWWFGTIIPNNSGLIVG